MEQLSSVSNDKIKLAVGVRDSARTRREKRLFFLEGARLCADAAANGIALAAVFVTSEALEKYDDYLGAALEISRSSYVISPKVAEKLSDTRNTQGVFALCDAVENRSGADALDANGKYILLENVQDPSNLGAVSRTAEALGLDGLIINGGCDIYNPKALRASMGAMLRINVTQCDDAARLLRAAAERGMLTVASTPSRECRSIADIDFSGGTICVVGNEGSGITPETASACKVKATIPMRGRAESLNASTAAAILIWEMVENGK